MYQFYVFELQQYSDGTYGDIKHVVYDEDLQKARRKAESKYYEVLAAAAISELPSHAALLSTSGGIPLMHYCYSNDMNEEEII